MKNWNLVDKCISKIEEFLGIDTTGLSADRDDLSDEIVMLEAEASHYKEAYEKIRKYRTPRPLKENDGIFSCPRCSMDLFTARDFESEERRKNYCPYCGQKVYQRILSEAAERFLKEME